MLKTIKKEDLEYKYYLQIKKIFSLLNVIGTLKAKFKA